MANVTPSRYPQADTYQLNRTAIPAQPALLLTPEEAAGSLRVGRTKIFELISSGHLQSVTIGRRRLIAYAALKRYVEQLSNPPLVPSA